MANSTSTRHPLPALAMLVMVASGFAGLGYQIAWTQQVALWLGHDGVAVLAVVGGFFGGLALGALALARRIDRSAHPARWYAGCELAMALWGAALVLLVAPVGRWMMLAMGAQPTPAWQWLVALLGTFLLLLPATLAMGATLPAMQRMVAGPQQPAAAIGWLYAGNTTGALLGVLACAFWLVPAIGLARTALLCVLLNLGCAAAALAWRPRAAPVASTTPLAPPARWWLPLAATGVLGIGLEVLVVRVLSQVAENTVYTFALLLAVYLVATALGAAAWQRWATPRPAQVAGLRWRQAQQANQRLLLVLAAACLASGGSLWWADATKATVLQWLGPSMPAALVAEATLAVLAFGLPAACMGALFSQLCSQARSAGASLGRCLGINTLGAALAPLLVGVLVLPAVGAKATLLLLVAGYALLMPRRSWATLPVAALVVAGLAMAVLAPPLHLIDVPEGGRLLSHAEGAHATVSVVEDADGVSRLHIDNRQQEGSSNSLLADARQALLPLLLHPAPRRALFLGLGTGVTAASAAEDAQLQVDAVELLPDVIRASAHFTQALHGGLPNARLHLLNADARRFVRNPGPAYDLVVADNFHPARSGSAALYTVEHFRAVADRLAPGGVFCQWLPLHQLNQDSLRSIVRSFTSVYPAAWAMLATNSLQTPVLGLVARRDGLPFDVPALRQRLATVALPQPPASVGIHDDLALLGGFIAGPQALARYGAFAPLNTDDHPVVAYLAPRITYAPDSTPRQRLLDLLQALQLQPEALVAPGTDAAWRARLAAYWAARNAFIAAGQAVRPVDDARQMLAQVQAPLLAVLKISPDFRPAHDPLLRLAGALASSGAKADTDAAQALLLDLQRLQPAQALGSNNPALTASNTTQTTTPTILTR